MEDSKIRTSVDNAIRSLYQAIIVVNREGHGCNAVDMNDELRNVADYPTSFDELCQNLYENIHPADREDFEKFTFPTNFTEDLREKVYTSIECRTRHVDDRYYWSELIFCHATEEDSTIGGEYLFLISDINEKKQKELRRVSDIRTMFEALRDKYDDLFEENMRDQQTGCYNRKGEEYYEDLVLRDAKNTGKYVFVCVSDLSGLKHLNDTYGHEAGDIAIAEVAKELMASAPKGSWIVRTGGESKNENMDNRHGL